MVDTTCPPDATLFLPDDEATSRLGQWFSRQLDRGDCVLLSGPIGAGKSHFARAFIRARLGQNEDVPSPTFTLVQSYEDLVDIWHADLYRLTHPDEVLELGLDQAFDQAITLIEWPDRLGHFAPATAIRISLSSKDGGRQADIWLPGRADLVQALGLEWGRDD